MERKHFGTDRYIQVSRNQIQQLHPRMLMRPRLLHQRRFEFRIEGVQFALGCIEVQAFEVVCDASSQWIVWKSQPLLLTRNSHHMTLARFSILWEMHGLLII